MKTSPVRNSGIKRLMKAAQYSWSGLKTAFKNEAAFRQDCLLCAAVLLSCAFLGVQLWQFLFLLFACFALLSVEVLNSAVEWAVDLCTSEIHPAAKNAKDLGSAAVLLALCNLLISALAIFAANIFSW